MGSLVGSYGVNFAPMGPDIDIGCEAASIRGHSSNWMAGFVRVMKFSFAMLGRPGISVTLMPQAIPLITTP
jgi:hypothetical protein